MILKKKLKKKISKKTVKSNFFKYYFYFTISLIIISLYLFLTSDMLGYYKLKLTPRLNAHGILNYTKLPEIFFLKIKGHLTKKKKIFLEIDFENLSKIENERENVIKETKDKNQVENVTFKFNEYKARIISDGKKIPIRIRLKGDRQIHWKDKRNSSYRIKIRGKNRFNGIKEFSIQKPRARNYIYEWIYHELNSQVDDSISLKYEFFDLYINGENYGLYVLEESFSHILIERSKKRNGPIFSLKEDYLSNFDNKKFNVFDKSTWTSSENIDLTNSAYTKLNKFLNGQEKLSKTFNIKTFAWYMATSELLGTYHGMNLKSSKFYYNPISGLFEIIAFDGHYINPILSHSKQSDRDKLIPEIVDENEDLVGGVDFGIFLGKKIHKDKEFAKEYYAALKKISSKSFLETFFNSREKKINTINSLIYSDYFFNDFIAYYGPGIYYFDIDSIYRRAKMIRGKLETNEFKIFSSIENNNLIIENSNFYNPYLILEKVNCNEKDIIFEKPIILKNFYNEIKNDKLINSNCNTISLVNKLTQKEILIDIDKINKNVSLYSENYNITKYFNITDNQIFLKKNITTIKENLTIPENLYVIIKPGQKIILENNSFITSYSPWLVNGLENNKVEISGTKNNLGGGLLISSTVEKSIFKNVNFNYLEGLKNNSLNNLIILGSINFYKTKLELSNITFNEISSEDAINVFDSSFKISDVKFTENDSDAIDFDFSNGVINNASFENIGNDAIDFSGSKVIVEDIYFNNVSDKIISVGENSNINIKDIDGYNSFVGIACKDGSIVEANNVNMKNVKIPFASYNKKFEYGKSKIFLSEINIANYKEEWLTDKNSKIFYKGNPVGVISKKIIPIIYNKDLSLIKSFN